MVYRTVANGAAGYLSEAVACDAPVAVEDLPAETCFQAPPLLLEHDVLSGVSVVIHGRDRPWGTNPWGVLGAHNRRRRTFIADDVNFLSAMDNKLALAIDRHDADQELHERNHETRDAVSALHPVTLERGGLQSAIEATVDFHAMEGGFETTVEVAREAPSIQDQVIVSLARERLALTSGW